METLNPLEVVSIVLVQIIAINLYNMQKKSFGFVGLNMLYIYHLTFCFGYAYYIYRNGGDAFGYYERGLMGDFSIDVGTDFVTVICWLLISIFGFSFVGLSILFSFFGYIGILLIYYVLKIYANYLSVVSGSVILVFLFLPSLHFWSSGIGKDSMIVFAIGLFVFSLYSNRKISTLISFVLIVCIRPHIGAIFAFAYFFVSFCSIMTWSLSKTVYMIVMVSLFGATVGFFLQRYGISGIYELNIFEYVVSRQEYNTDGGSSFDIKMYSNFELFFNYLFFPVFDYRNSLFIMISVENGLLLFIFILLLSKINFFLCVKISRVEWILLTYAIFATLILSMTTANYGIIMRQKWMIVPVFVILITGYLNRQRVRRTSGVLKG